MRLSVCFTPGEVEPADVRGATAVVIDVVRATSCIVEAMANGARGVLPAISIDEAGWLRDSLQRNGALLCGERHGLRIEGFDLGNSPAEFTREAVAGRHLVMTTTNGTRALVSAVDADRILVASFLNLGAVADAIRGDASVVIVCAGKAGGFAMDDTVCAGHILRSALDGWTGPLTMDERARAAVDLAGLHEVSAEMLAGTEAGQALVDVGLGSDLALCARADRHQIVPMMCDRVISAPSP